MNKIEADQFNYLKTVIYKHKYTSISYEFEYDLSNDLDVSVNKIECWVREILLNERALIELISEKRGIPTIEAIQVFLNEKLYL